MKDCHAAEKKKNTRIRYRPVSNAGVIVKKAQAHIGKELAV